MGLEVVLGQKTDVIGGYHRQFQLRCELHRPVDVSFLAAATCADQFQIEPFRKSLSPQRRCSACPGKVALGQDLAHFTVAATGKHQQPLLPCE